MAWRALLVALCLGNCQLSSAEARDLADNAVLYQSRVLLHSNHTWSKMRPTQLMTGQARRTLRKATNKVLERVIKKLDIESDPVNLVRGAIAGVIAEYAVTEYKKPRTAAFLGLMNDIVDLLEQVFSQPDVVDMEGDKLFSLLANMTTATKELNILAQRMGAPHLVQTLTSSLHNASNVPMNSSDPFKWARVLDNDLRTDPVFDFIAYDRESKEAGLDVKRDEDLLLDKLGSAMGSFGFPPSIINLIKSMHNITENQQAWRLATSGIGPGDYRTNPEGEVVQIVFREVGLGLMELGFPSSLVGLINTLFSNTQSGEADPATHQTKIAAAFDDLGAQMDLPEGLMRFFDFLWQSTHITDDAANPNAELPQDNATIIAHLRDIAEEIGGQPKGMEFMTEEMIPGLTNAHVDDWHRFADRAVAAVLESAPQGVTDFVAAYRSTPGDRSPEDTIRNVTKMLREVHMNSMADLTDAIEPFIKRRLKPDDKEFMLMVPKILKAQTELSLGKSILGDLHRKLTAPLASAYRHVVERFTEKMTVPLQKMILKHSWLLVEPFLGFWVAARLRNKPFKFYNPAAGDTP